MKNYVVPSPLEIKEKFQKASKAEDPWSHYVLRVISRHISWVVLHFTLWAEAVAMMTPVVDLIAIYLIYSGNFAWAALFTQLHIIVDSMDGEIARFRATVKKRTERQAKFGSFVDSMAGLLVYPLVIFSAGYFMDSLITGLVGMASLYLTVVSSVYIKVYFPQKKSRGAEIRNRFFGKFNTKLGFSSAVQKSLITLALLFQSLIFIWIFILGALFVTFLRFYLYRK